ncbi:MAG: tRNA (adenosine(37)-N6)-dimethylallyltransferase MiaA [Treponema sp.]|nr:tRNA (adenosine(37)-N6)-dimethylallyltransferase MiaA [Treponema sp.]
MDSGINCVALVGPTAVGKTSLGVRLSDHYGWDIISADSRQIYKGLDLGSGKDLGEYNYNGKSINHHLIDITTLESEYNVFCFQQDFYKIFRKNQNENKMSFIVGGTGMYVDSIVSDYQLLPVPEQPDLVAELEKKSTEELAEQLLKIKPFVHNKSDLVLKDRLVKALSIELFKLSDEGKKMAEEYRHPQVNTFVIGTTLERDQLHKNIRIRLEERIEQGMIEEVENLHKTYSWERLEKLGLEYRFVSLYLEGKISTKEEMTEQLYHAISQFAKRQETWFRGMEKKGVKINWLPSENDKEKKFSSALELIDRALKR